MRQRRRGVKGNIAPLLSHVFQEGKRRKKKKGYESQGFVPEVHHRVAAGQRVHEADHVMSALGALLRRHLVGDDVEALVHLRMKNTYIYERSHYRRVYV